MIEWKKGNIYENEMFQKTRVISPDMPRIRQLIESGELMVLFPSGEYYLLPMIEIQRMAEEDYKKGGI